MQIKTLHYYAKKTPIPIMQHANQNITLLYKNYQYSATCKSKHYTTIKKTTNIMQHANQNITLL